MLFVTVPWMSQSLKKDSQNSSTTDNGPLYCSTLDNGPLIYSMPDYGSLNYSSQNNIILNYFTPDNGPLNYSSHFTLDTSKSTLYSSLYIVI